ncbi:MAG: efflux RND transporter permease subunit [bacterium]
MSLARFSVNQKVLVNIITFLAIVVGAYTAFNMQREAMPDISLNYAFVQTVYPGASPQEVEKLVTIPVEDAIKGIDEIDTYNSVSREGVSFVFIELDPDISEQKTESVINNIAREVDKIKLPDDAEDPNVDKLNIHPPLIEISFTGEDMPEEELREYVRGFEDILKNMEGVASVERIGWRDKEVSIEVNPDDLESYYISLAQVIRSIENQHVNLPGGKLKDGSKEIIIRTVGELDSAKEFKEVIVRTNADGRYISVGDVAKVNETFEERMRIYKTDGKVSINLLPKKKKSGDTITIVDQIKKEIKSYRKVVPKNVSVDTLFDMAFYVERRLNVLTNNGLMGLGLLLLTLLVFLNVRIALVTAVGIPFAFLSALLMMSFFGVTLNLITMFGLIMVVGMIVDDAIVVSENAYRYMEKGMPIREAAIKGAEEVAAPVTTTILTTAAAFLPLMFISGIMGKYLRFFPMGVIFCLVASLFEALIILPSHLAEWISPLKGKEHFEEEKHDACPVNSRPLFSKIICFPLKAVKTVGHYLFSNERKGSDAAWFQKLLGTYKRLLNFSIARRYLLTGLAGLVLVVSITASVLFMPFNLFPSLVEIFYVRIETPEGTSLEGTNEPISAIEQIILDLPDKEIENVTTTVGFSGEIGGGPFDKHGSKYAQCVVYLTPHNARKRGAEKIMSEIRKGIEKSNIPNIVTFSVEAVRDGPPVGKPVSVQVRGDDYKILDEVSKEIQAYLATVSGVKDIRANYELDKEEIRVSVDKKEAARLGLSVRQVASTIRYAFQGGVATTMRKGDEDIDVIVRLPEKFTQDIETLKNLTIPNNQERLIKLSRVASFSKSQGIMSFDHDDGIRTITVTANVEKEVITAVEANRLLIDKFADIPERFPGYYMKAGGEWEDTAESIRSMFKAFLVAFLLIYMILATQFRSFVQPLVIMTSIPFGIIGVIIALAAHGEPISLMAMFGVIGLTGVVVNDALILVDFINKRREKGLSPIDAVKEAGAVRLRPILLTSITTIIALMPLIYGIGGEEPFMLPSAIAMAYGLLAATFLTLVIVPCVYLIVEDMVCLVGKRKAKRALKECFGNTNNT